MASYIAFNDGSAGVLQSSEPAPGDRFVGWRPEPEVIGVRNHALVSRVPYVYLFGIDTTVEFSIARIKPANLDIVQRFKVHAEVGSLFDIYTGDLAARQYLNCRIAEKGTVKISEPDEENLYSVSMLVSIPGGVWPLCVYSV